jgi:hypothetical protein
MDWTFQVNMCCNFFVNTNRELCLPTSVLLLHDVLLLLDELPKSLVALPGFVDLTMHCEEHVQQHTKCPQKWKY